MKPSFRRCRALKTNAWPTVWLLISRFRLEEKQLLLEITDPIERMEKICDLIEVEIEKIKMDKSIQGRVRKQMEKAQREYYLNEKIKAIQKELGRNDKDEIEELKEKIEEAQLPPDARQKADAEIRRLEQMPPMSAETTVSRTYLDWLISVPWSKKSREIRDIKKAEKILDADHYGLEDVKERVLEFLAVASFPGRRIRVPFSVLRDRREWGRPLWVGPLPGRWDGSLSGCPSAVCVMRRRFEDIEGPILELCRARSSR